MRFSIALLVSSFITMSANADWPASHRDWAAQMCLHEAKKMPAAPSKAPIRSDEERCRCFVPKLEKTYPVLPRTLNMGKVYELLAECDKEEHIVTPATTPAGWPDNVRQEMLETCTLDIAMQLPPTQAGMQKAQRFCQCVVDKTERANPSPPANTSMFQIKAQPYMNSCRGK